MFISKFKFDFDDLEERVSKIEDIVNKHKEILDERFLTDAKRSFDEKEKKLFNKAKKEIMNSMPNLEKAEFWDSFKDGSFGMYSYFATVYRYRNTTLFYTKEKRVVFDGFVFSQKYADRLCDFNSEIIELKGLWSNKN